MIHNNVPSFVSEMEQIKELFDILQIEVDIITSEIENIVKQFYIKTADFDIAEWEKDFHIEVNDNLVMEARRARVLAKINTRTPASKTMLENLVFQILQPKEVYIINQQEQYQFNIYVVNDKTRIDIHSADVAVADARPAHLAYQFIILVKEEVMLSSKPQYVRKKYKQSKKKNTLKLY